MKNNFSIIGLLFSIPVLISLSWVLSSFFLGDFSAAELTIARLFLATIILLIIFFFKKPPQLWSLKWMLGQTFLAITGRLGYLLASTLALESISSVQALILMDLSPLISILLASVLNNGKALPKSTTLVLISLSSIFAIYTFSSGKTFGTFQQSGTILMLVALLLFAIHLHFYQKLSEGHSMIDTLLFQFGVSALILGPFHLEIGQKLISLSIEKLALFLFYAFVCNLLPFFIVHHLLKKVNYIFIQLVSTLSPLFGILFSSIVLKTNIQSTFLINTFITVILIFITIYFHKRSEQT